MAMEAPQPSDRTEVRLRSLEQRLDSLEQVGKEGLPAIRLTAIEVSLGHLEQGQRELKDDLNRRFSEQNTRISRLETLLEGVVPRLAAIIGLATAIISASIVLSQLYLP